MTITATTADRRPAYIADVRDGMHIEFVNPRDGKTIIRGMVFGDPVIDRAGPRATPCRVFRIFGHDRLFRVSASYHVTIYRPYNG